MTATEQQHRLQMRNVRECIALLLLPFVAFTLLLPDPIQIHYLYIIMS